MCRQDITKISESPKKFNLVWFYKHRSILYSYKYIFILRMKQNESVNAESRIYIRKCSILYISTYCSYIKAFWAWYVQNRCCKKTFLILLLGVFGCVQSDNITWWSIVVLKVIELLGRDSLCIKLKLITSKYQLG